MLDFYFVCEILNKGDIELKKISTKDNLADMLIKMVTVTKFNHCKKLLYISQVPWDLLRLSEWTKYELISLAGDT